MLNSGSRRIIAYTRLRGVSFPPPGTLTQPIEAGYMANAWMRVRHPDYDELRHILNTIGQTIRVRAH